MAALFFLGGEGGFDYCSHVPESPRRERKETKRKRKEERKKHRNIEMAEMRCHETGVKSSCWFETALFAQRLFFFLPMGATETVLSYVERLSQSQPRHYTTLGCCQCTGRYLLSAGKEFFLYARDTRPIKDEPRACAR